MNVIDIAELSLRTGLPASTLRFYEEKGLIRSIGRRGLRRIFDAAVLRQLALIGLGRAGGFSLDEIAGMFDPDGRPKIDRGQIERQAEEVDMTIRRLEAVRDGLRHVAACPAENHLACPSFERLLQLSAAGKLAGQDEPSSLPRVRKRRTGRGRP